MAALCKKTLAFYPACKRLASPSFALNLKRFLRVDPEEEIERLFISKTFAQRYDKQCSERPFVKVIGRQPGQKQKEISSAGTKLSENISASDNQSLLASRLDGPFPISLNDVHEMYLQENGSANAVNVLQHYNVLKDLFGDAIFYPDPALKFRVAYNINEEEVLPVFLGNKIDPIYTVELPPLVGFVGNSEKLYSLLMINLDGHLSKPCGEYLHWSCINMSGVDGLPSGKCSEYLPCIPLMGTGFHRYVFILLEHNTPMDSSLIPNIESSDLNSRDFNFAAFYSKMDENDVVPVGIQFFQSEWDPTVRKTFHHTLDMPEPAYHYDYPHKEAKTQIKYAHNQPFQQYLDTYRDKKEVAEQVLKEHLSEMSPYQHPEAHRLPYPLARPTKPGLYRDQLPPTWIQKELVDKTNREGKYKYIYSDS